MPGYANPLVRVEFPDLSEPDDLIHVTIRNPKTLPLDQLTPRDIELDEHGRPKRLQDGVNASYELLARIVVDWHVYDATGESSDALPLPATPDMLHRLPAVIVASLSQRITEAVNPR